jgi:hypothetical protein
VDGQLGADGPIALGVEGPGAGVAGMDGALGADGALALGAMGAMRVEGAIGWRLLVLIATTGHAPTSCNQAQTVSFADAQLAKERRRRLDAREQHGECEQVQRVHCSEVCEWRGMWNLMSNDWVNNFAV